MNKQSESEREMLAQQHLAAAEETQLQELERLLNAHAYLRRKLNDAIARAQREGNANRARALQGTSYGLDLLKDALRTEPCYPQETRT
jgi:hypothetical protein